MGGSSLLHGSDGSLVREDEDVPLPGWRPATPKPWDWWLSRTSKPRRWKAGERAPWGRRKKHRDALTRVMRREGMQAPEPRRPWPDGPGYYEQLMEHCPDWPRKRT